jgi:hypothetical protein
VELSRALSIDGVSVLPVRSSPLERMDVRNLEHQIFCKTLGLEVCWGHPVMEKNASMLPMTHGCSGLGGRSRITAFGRFSV